MFPPFARTGPVTPVEMVCVDGVQPAQAAPGSPTATSAASEALGEQEIARNPHAASECRDDGNVLNLANASPIPLAALDHAHDVAPFKGQKITSVS